MSEENMADGGGENVPMPVAISMRPDALLLLLLEVLFDTGLLVIVAKYPYWLQLLLSSLLRRPC